MTRFAKFLKDERGSSTIEFVLLFPAFVVVMLSAVESGIFMIRSVMLERGVDLAVRELRLGINVPSDEQELITMVCNHSAFLQRCPEIMRLELVQIDMATWNFPSTAATCTISDELLQPELGYTVGVDHNLMLLRVCAVMNPWFPSTGIGLGLPKNEAGLYSLTAASAFVVEPS